MTVASMTGFGRCRGALSERLGVAAVIRSVNHRYLDLQVRINLREEMPEAEAVVREVVGRHCERGRVTAQLVFERSLSTGGRAVVDRAAVQSVLGQLRALEAVEQVSTPVEVRDVLALPGLVLVSSDETVLSDEEQRRLREVVEEAATQLRAMRVAEGERLAVQVAEEVGRLTAFLDWLEPRLPDLRVRLHDRLRERIAELLASGPAPDDDRLAQEAALLADRADVAEEVVRLRSHLNQLRSRMERGGAVGRTLDFLCQEVNRELNTLAAKCRDLEVVERLVEARASTERVREQIQNLE
jgi:uncharacterized protein (TIGR00255 family)